jgi:hypothetical protein
VKHGEREREREREREKKKKEKKEEEEKKKRWEDRERNAGIAPGGEAIRHVKCAQLPRTGHGG